MFVIGKLFDSFFYVGQKGQKRIAKMERDTNAFALSKFYNGNYSLFERLLIGSGQPTQSIKKVVKTLTKRNGPSILDILYNRKKSECPMLMGVKKFVFVLEHKRGSSNVCRCQIGNFILPIDQTNNSFIPRPPNSNHISFWLSVTISSDKAMIPPTSSWWP